MGFDNECIPNIQSLAGEYFCPVCRLLVYPNEALQSQCTHLYCKPCLTYVVSTTKACPYDGYLVTEADSKPLMEANKVLAETIGKIVVHCLYHRSGCMWQGPLSESTSHCSVCAFGNSAVVCNRCGIQIAHRQVQEHAQNCPGQQSGSQAAATTSSAATGGLTQTPSQTNTSQATTALANHNQQVVSNPQGQTMSSAVLPTPEQWFQQQQYQQYYQKYSGYYPYQQLYLQYPYQQPSATQSHAPQAASQPQAQGIMQPLVQSQPQVQLQGQNQPQPQGQGMVQPQSHPVGQPTPVSQPQNLATVTTHPQTHPEVPPNSQVPSQTYPPSQGHPHLLAQPYSQPLPISQAFQNQPHVLPVQMSQHQQFPGQMQPPLVSVQSQLHMQHSLPQSQANPSKTNQPLYPEAQPQTQLPSAHAVTAHQSYPQTQSNQQMQLGTHQLTQSVHAQNHYPQQQTNLHPLQSHVAMPNQQQPTSQFPSIHPIQPQPLHPHVHQPGFSALQCHGMQPVQQPLPQQPVAGQTSGTVHTQMHPQSHVMHQPLTMQSQLRPQGPPQHQQSHHNVALLQSMQLHQPQNLTGQTVMPSRVLQPQPHHQSPVALQGRPMQIETNQPIGSQSDVQKTRNQLPVVSVEQSSKPTSEKQDDHGAKTGEDDRKARSNSDPAEMRTAKTENDIKPLDDGIKAKADIETKSNKVDDSVKEIPQSKQGTGTDLKPCATESRGPIPKKIQDGPVMRTPQQADHSKEYTGKMHKDRVPPQLQPTNQGPGAQLPRPGQLGGLVTNQGRNEQLIHYGPSTFQQRPGTPPMAFRPHPRPGAEVLPGVRPASLALFDRGLGQYGPSQRINQGHPPPSHASKVFPDAINSSGKHSSAYGLQDESLRGLPEDGLNLVPIDPARRREFEEDLKHFPRPLHLDGGPVPRSGAYFSSLRLFDRGFGMDVQPRPYEKHGLDFDVGTTSRFLQPYNNLENKSLGHHEDGKGRSEIVHDHPGFHGPVSRSGHRHIDGPRSPMRDYPLMPFRGYGASHGIHRGSRLSMDDIDGMDPHRFGFSSHLHGREFVEDLGNLGRSERLQSGDLIGRDVPSHIRRVDPLGPRAVLSHPQLEEQVGFGGFPGHARMAEEHGNFPRPRPRIGEPGFRSSFSLQGFPNDSGPYAGNMEPSENSRKRKQASMGWCRICKVDCETVEGLELHSQTKEHQKRSMDMVQMIKQNSKKYKKTSCDRALDNTPIKAKSANSEGHSSKKQIIS